MLRYQRSRWTPRIKLYCCIRNYLSAYNAGTSLYVDAATREFAGSHIATRLADRVSGRNAVSGYVFT